jgi:WD40 repeat protein
MAENSDLSTHRSLLRLRQEPGDPTAWAEFVRRYGPLLHTLVFSPDGTRLLSGSGDRTVRIWHTKPLPERAEWAENRRRPSGNWRAGS